MLDLDPQSIKHRCLAYCYTHCQIQYNAYIQKADGPPSQLSIDVLAYHYTHCQIQYYAYIQMANGPPVNQEQMPCILLQPLLDLDPQSIELRWPSYSYTHCQIQYNAYIQKADGPPSPIEHKCLACCYTPLLDLVLCIYIDGIWTLSQSRIDALHTATATARSRPHMQACDPPNRSFWENGPCSEGFNTHLWGFQEDRWENIYFLSKPRHVTPQIDCLGKRNPVLRVSTHIYGVSKEIDGENIHLLSKCRHVTLQIDCLGKTSPVLRVSIQISGVSKKIDGKTLIF